MGGVGSKRSLSITAGKYRITRHIRQLCAQRRRHEDFVQQSRPIRFFNITKTSAEASVAVNKEAIIRAYLVPDGGTAAIQLIEFQAEPEVDYTLEFKNLKPGTLYRLKIYYVPDTYKKVLSSTGTFLRREGQKILRSFKSDKVDGRRQTFGATRKRWTMAADTQAGNVLIRRATGRTALESTRGRHEELPDVTFPREGFPGEKPVGIPVNYPKKLEVRTLPADWKGRESTQPRAMTQTFASGVMPV